MAAPRPPSGPDVNLGPELLIITGVFQGLAVLFYLIRMYSRMRPVILLGWDDYTISIGVILSLLEWSLLAVSVTKGLGRHQYYLEYIQVKESFKWLYFSTLPWTWVLVCIKSSIACLLLRLKYEKTWRMFLYVMIIIQILNASASTIFILVQCRPIRTFWDPAGNPQGHCASAEASNTSIYVYSGINIATDLIFAVLPITFIVRLQQPLRQKIVLTCLMGMGIFATAASIVRTRYISNYGQTGDATWDSASVTIWCLLETAVGIIAACIPCMKQPFESGLRRLGLMKSQNSAPSYESRLKDSKNSNVPRHRVGQLESVGQSTMSENTYINVQEMYSVSSEDARKPGVEEVYSLRDDSAGKPDWRNW